MTKQTDYKPLIRRMVEIDYQYKHRHLPGSLSAIYIIADIYAAMDQEHDIFILSKGHSCAALYAVLESYGKKPDVTLVHPERDVANRARLHLAMCDRRLQQTTVSLGSAEDYYNYGVALINSRNLPEARTHLEKALEMSPAADHVHYALALAQALAGDLTNAQQNLKRAIELEPRNRLIARQDADFAPLASQPPFDALIYPEKKSW